SLEGNVIVCDLGLRAPTVGRGCDSSALLVSRFVFSAQHHHIVGTNLSGITLIPLFVFPASCLNSALDKYPPAFVQVLAADFRELIPSYNVVPFSPLLFFAILVFPDLIGGQGKLRNGSAALSVFHFRVLTQSAYQDDFVY